MEMMGLMSERCELNRQIKADNKILYQRKEQVEELLEKLQILVKLDCQENEIKIRTKRLKDIELFLEKLEKQSTQLLKKKKKLKFNFLK